MADGAVLARHTDAPLDRIVFLGHSTALIEVDGVRVLTDPLLRGRVAHLRRQVPLPQEAVFADPDAVLISHMHHDHLDPASLRLLGRDTPLIVPVGAAAWLHRRGFLAVSELGVGDVARVGRLRVTAVEAHHDGRRLGGPRAPALGYLIAGGRVVYFAGDTERFAGMANFSPSPEVALVPVAGWGPRLGQGHMNALDSARAVASMRLRVAVPIHWGTLLPIALAPRHRARLGDPPRLFAEHVARLAPSVDVRILVPGQQTVL